MNDIIRSGYVPVLTAATAMLLTAGLLTATSGTAITLLAWSVALVAAVVQFLTAGRLGGGASVAAAIVSLLGAVALWGAVAAGAAWQLAGAATLLYLALAVGVTLVRAVEPTAAAH